MVAFDLRAEVKNMLASSDIANPGEIADKVAESVPTKALRMALRITLRAYVRQIMSEQRTRSNARHPLHTNGTTGTSATSWRGDAIREGWQKQLHTRVHVGGKEWKFLADCNYENLQTLASEREANADKNRAWARHYRGIAALLTEHDVTTVRDLPVEVLMHALGAKS